MTSAYRNHYSRRNGRDLGYIALGAGNIARETEKAIALSLTDSPALVWLPKSQIDVTRNGQGVTITMAYWLARDKGLTGWDAYGYPLFWFESDGEGRQ